MEDLEGRLLMANDLDDQISEAISLGTATTAGKSNSEAVSPDTDVDMYSFSVSAGQFVDFDIDTAENGNNGLGSYIRLFNASGTQLATNNDAAAPGENTIGYDAYLRYGFATAGTYYLGVSNANNTGYNAVTGDGDAAGGQFAIGNYKLTVTLLPIDTNDSIPEATALGAISSTAITRNDAINPDIDVDLYSFTVTNNQTVDFDIDTALNGDGGLGSYIRLFNSSGAQLTFNDDGAAPGENVIGFDAYLRYTFATGGTYYLGVSNYNNAAYNASTGLGDTAGGLYSIGDYTLIVQTAPTPPTDTDDTIAESISLGAASTTPSVTNASISVDVDVDMYRFTVTAGQSVDFDIDTALNGPGGLGAFLRLFNAQGTELDFNNDANAPGENTVGYDAYLRYRFTAAGTYYIGVSNSNNTLYSATLGTGDTSGGLNATGDYQLTVVALPVDTDDQITEAVPLGQISASPVSRSARIDPDIDVDMYSFIATANMSVDFDIDTTQNGTGGLGSYLRIFNSAGQQLAANDDGVAPGESTLGFDAYLRYTFTTGGTYYVGVSNNTNKTYSATGDGNDVAGGLNSIGDYTLILQTPASAAGDSDDAISEATPLGAISTTPSVNNAEISVDTDVDMFSFTVTAGLVVDFDVDTPNNGAGSVQSYLRVFNASGTELTSNNDGTAPGENTLGFDAYLRYTFAAGGTYYVAVSNASNVTYNAITGAGDTAGGANATGAYQLRVIALPIDTDDETTEATALGAITTTAIKRSDTINPDIDVDLYAFSVAAGQVVDFDIDTLANGVGGLGSFLRLFNSAGVQIAFNNDAAGPNEPTVGFDAYLRYTFSAAGNYYIGVSNANNTAYNIITGGSDAPGGQYSIGDYDLFIQTPTLPANDTDDAISEAVSLGAASTTAITRSGAISPDTDVDMFSFTVTSGQVVDFDIDTALNGGTGLGSYLRVFNAQGQELAFNNDGSAPGEGAPGFDAYLRYTFAAAGTYYVAVSNFNNISYDPTSGNGDTAGGSNATGDYQLIVQALPVDTDDAFTEASVLGAITTTANITNSTINPDIDVDMYRFTVTAGQIVDFDIDTATNGGTGLNSYLRVFNSQGVQLSTNDNATAIGEATLGFDAYLRVTFAAAGTYYVGVSNYNNTTYDGATGNADSAGGLNSIGDYTLTVQTPAPVADDADDTIAEAVSIGAASTTASTTNGVINPDTDVDMIKFTVTAGQIVDFDIDTALNGSTGLNSYLRLFDSQGNQLASNNNAAALGETAVSFDAYLRYTFTTAGTFYVGVSNATNVTYSATTGNGDLAGGQNSTGDYALVITALPVDPDDSISESSNLGAISTTATSISAGITPDIDVDMYRFTVTAGQIVDFDIDTALNGAGGLGSFLRVFNSAGTQLASNDNAAAPGETTLGFDAYLRFTFATAGTYYVGVSNSNNTAYDPATGNGDTSSNSNSIGDYTLVVQTAPAVVTDPDDTLAEALAINAISTTTQQVTGGITPDIDVDMIKFTVTAGQVVDFDIDTLLNGSTGLNSYLRLFNSQGQQLASNDNAVAAGEASVGFDAYLRYTFTTAGTYYVAVSNSTNISYDPTTGDGDTAGGQNTTGEYLLLINEFASTTDSDDAISEATALGAINSTANTSSAAITPDTDVDMYSFTVTAGQVVDFDIDTPQNGTGGVQSYIRLFNASGTQLTFNDNATAPGEATLGFDSYVRFTFATAGTYYVGVSNANNTSYDPSTGNGDTAGGSNTTGAYQLIVQTAQTTVTDADDAISEATPLGQITTSSNTTSANISPDTDVDMLGFSVTAGQVIDFDVDTALNGSTGLNSYIRVFNAQGQELASNNNAAAPGEDTAGFDAYLRYTFATAGTYYVAVSNSTNITYNATTGDGDTAGGQNTIGAYSISITGLPVDTDDTIAEAASIGAVTTGGTTLSGTINPDIDVDVTRFTVTAGQTVDFDVDTDLNGTGGLNSFIRIFDSSGNVLATNNNASAPGESTVGLDAYLRYTFATAGSYYVAVSNATNINYNVTTGNGDTAGGVGSIGDYRLSVQSVVVVADDPDDTIAEAVSVGAASTTAQSIDSSLTSATDVNMVKFTVTAGQTVDFDIDTTTNGGAGLQSYIRVFNASGAQLAANDNATAPGEGSVGFDAYLRFTFSTAGTYYVAVSNASNTAYDAVTGTGDATGGSNTNGPYTLIIQAQAPAATPTLTLLVNPTSIAEVGGVATGTVTRVDADASAQLTVNVFSANTNSATVPATVTIPAGQTTATFQVTAVHDTSLATRTVSISVSSVGFVNASQSITITDSDSTGHNNDIPEDVSGDGAVSPFDALLIINYLNSNGPGPVPNTTGAPYLDVNADGFVTAIDALFVINRLNTGGGEGEGESSVDLDTVQVRRKATDDFFASF